MTWMTALLAAGARSAATELIKAGTIAGVTYAGYQVIRYRQNTARRVMGQEQQKILEMVANGKITPEEGVRLLNAVAPGGSNPRPPMGIPDVKLPRIDLSGLGEVAMELKNTVFEGAGRAGQAVRKSRAGQYIDPKVYTIEGPPAEGIANCELKLNVQAGKLRLKAADTEGSLLKGRVKRVAKQPELHSSVVDGTAKLELEHRLGTASLNLIDWPIYRLQVENSAADTLLDLSHLRVAGLVVANNASSVVAKLSALIDNVQVNIENNAGSVVLQVPGSHAIRVVATQALSNSNLEKLGLKTVAGAAQSTDWEHNERRVEIVLVQNVASFELKWERAPGEGFIEVLDSDTAGHSNGHIPSSEL